MCHELLYCRSKFIAMVLTLLAIILTGCLRRVVSVPDVEKMIKEQVPVGSDQQRVRAFIDNLKIDSLKIDRDGNLHKASPEALMGHDQEKIAELGDRIAAYTGAFIHRSRSDGILTSDNILILFYLDKDGRMIGYNVTESGSD